MIEDHFPEFYRKADQHSLRWQRRYLHSERIQLGSLLLAAAIAAITDDMYLLVVVLFAVGLVAHLYRLATRADEKWWNGRAGAESAKTLAWKFVVAGEPFAADNVRAEEELANRLAEIATKVAKLMPVSVGQGPVSAHMRAARASPTKDRVVMYQDKRVRAQMSWYDAKSSSCAQNGMRWSLAVVATQAAALVLGIIGVRNDWTFDFVGVFSAAAASGVAWIAVKQYEVLARSYAVASNELSAIDARIGSRTWADPEWAAFVNESEEAISREHTSWRASRAI